MDFGRLPLSLFPARDLIANSEMLIRYSKILYWFANEYYHEVVQRSQRSGESNGVRERSRENIVSETPPKEGIQRKLTALRLHYPHKEVNLVILPMELGR